MSIPSFPEITDCGAADRRQDRAEPLRAAPPAIPATLADLLTCVVVDDALTPLRRRDLRSALQTFARVTSRPPEMIRIDPPSIRALVRGVIPRAVGISPKRWANVRSDLGSALARYPTGSARRLRPGLLPEWRQLKGAIEDEGIARALSRFFRYCSDRGIAPQQVDQPVFEDYRRWLNEGALVAQPDQIYKRSCQRWNQAARVVAGWPALEADVPDFTFRFALPQEVFPTSFRNEVARWAACMTGTDLFGEGPSRPLRPLTVRHAVGQIYRFASALVHSGHAPEDITSLSNLVEIEPFKDGIRFFLARREGKKTKGLSNMARLLTKIARHWVKVDEAQLKQITQIRSRLSFSQRALTEKNRRRLRQFDDLKARVATLTLPATLEKIARREPAGHRAALQIQTALMIQLLIHAPIRLANFVPLKLHQHFVRRGRAFHLAIPQHEVKNEEPLEFPLPPEVTRLFDLYVRSYRPLLLFGRDEGWLWPGRSGGPKHKASVTEQIIIALRRHAGVEMNFHLFRHLAAKLYLEHFRGDYEPVRRLLGHQSIDTTTWFYTGLEISAAARCYHEKVLGAARNGEGGADL